MGHSWLYPIAVVFILLVLYLRKINRVLLHQPSRALAISPHRWTSEEIESAYADFLKHPIDISNNLPPKTGHRYVVVGGSGFLGGWIVVHLLQRGENPKNIRVLDLRKPTRKDLTTGLAKEVDFLETDISDEQKVKQAFAKPWPSGASQAPLTVIHSAANIRFFERSLVLVPRSAKVNINGTRHVLDSAQAHGASHFIYTSSASIAIRRCRYWLWPWQSEPDHFVQILDDKDTNLPKSHESFFSNYAYTKSFGEGLVRARDNVIVEGGHRMRTGCLRPGNGVYGPGGDINVGAYLVRKLNPTWVQNSIQSECYVENISLAHLLYEHRFVEINSQKDKSTSLPDIGGQAFMIADPNPPVSYGDIYEALSTLSKGVCVFPKFPPVAMLIFAHVVEFYYLLHFHLTSLSFCGLGFLLSLILPPVGGDIVNLQPSLFPLTTVHLLLDDSRARLPAKDGGLDYHAPFTTLQGICKVVREHELNEGHVEGRQANGGGGIGFGFGLTKAERAVERAAEKAGALHSPTSHRHLN